MFAVTVTFAVAEGGMPRFLPLMRENARASREEPGCLRFDVATDPERPDTVFLWELYRDEAAFDAHRGTDHYARFAEVAAPLVASKRVETWAEVGP
ncbi:putative quinol monooxygenase [Jannaschia sp. W003]|uniref:putative quinol monooxygenase n=1 Tax=Jannaschia sp. W003 TaxID=2867012 RepID=UPI0021A8D390|nr:putative quinol monooxygenase [Jannaschia sp. W003]UWQ20628.1 antibiotic biosynthesis monooxygenase [Jannaschia sp. W003]